MDKNDEKLVADYLAGHEQSLELIFGRYLRPIYIFVCRYIGNENEAEDLTQEIFIKAWRNLKSFDLDRSFKTWIFSIAKNTAIDFLRKYRFVSGGKKEIPFSEFDVEKGQNFFANTIADSSLLPSSLAEQKDEGRILASAMEKLSSPYRMVLYLRLNDHFTFREIAQALGEPLNTVKSRHRRGLMYLRKLLPEK